MVAIRAVRPRDWTCSQAPRMMCARVLGVLDPRVHEGHEGRSHAEQPYRIISAHLAHLPTQHPVPDRCFRRIDSAPSRAFLNLQHSPAAVDLTQISDAIPYVSAYSYTLSAAPLVRLVLSARVSGRTDSCALRVDRPYTAMADPAAWIDDTEGGAAQQFGGAG